LGHNNIDCEAQGSAMLDSVSLDRWLLTRTAGKLVGSRFPPGSNTATLRGATRALPLLAAGTGTLALPLTLHRAVIHAPTLSPALAMTFTLFCFSAAWFLRVQFVDSQRLRDLLLLCVTTALGLTNLCFGALPAILDVRGGVYLASASLCGQMFVAGMFAVAATVSVDRVVARPGQPARLALLLGLGALGAAATGGLLMTRLGLGLGADTGARGETTGAVLVLATTCLLAYAAVMLGRQHLRRPDRVVALLALAGLLLASAALSLLTSPLAPVEVSAGTAMGVVASALLLCAAAALERRVRVRATRAAALAERRRVARDLHDGIAQDLAFIASHGEQIAIEIGEEHPLVVAAHRALAITRSTISELCDPPEATAGEALDAVAHELRKRFDVTIAVHAEIDGHVQPTVREHVTRIAREAIANAARHGEARNILVSLRRANGGVALRVVDDGCGVGARERGVTTEGFGLRSMRERAGALGGSLTIREAPQGGTELEVVLP